MTHRFTYIIHPICTIAIILLLASCHTTPSQTDIDSEIAAAEQALALNNARQAESIVNDLTAHIDSAEYTTRQLVSLSIIYMRIADDYDYETNVARAGDLFRQAYSTSADSAAYYYAHVAVDNMPYAETLSSLVTNMDNPYDFARDSLEYDSLMEYHIISDTTTIPQQ